MPANPVVFLDTSVFANILDVHGHAQNRQAILDEFEDLQGIGARFVLPITTIVETGNLIFYAGGDRRDAAHRLARALQAAQEPSPPWIVRDVNWDSAFVSALLAGGSTGSPLSALIGEKRLATGDVAILVERERFREGTAYTDVRIWSLDAQLSAFS